MRRVRSNTLRVVLLPALLALLLGCSSPPAPSGAATPVTGAAATLSVVERNDEFELSVPASRLVLRFPRGGLVRATGPKVLATANPRYFLFEDRSSGAVLSGWFEPAERFERVRATWQGDLKARAATAQPGAAFAQIGSWDTGSYVMDLGGEMRQSHLYAHLVRAGTWIELHLSALGRRPHAEQLEMLTEMIRSIQIQEKT
jgi:hypothetical protein